MPRLQLLRPRGLALRALELKGPPHHLLRPRAAALESIGSPHVAVSVVHLLAPVGLCGLELKRAPCTTPVGHPVVLAPGQQVLVAQLPVHPVGNVAQTSVVQQLPPQLLSQSLGHPVVSAPGQRVLVAQLPVELLMLQTPVVM